MNVLETSKPVRPWFTGDNRLRDHTHLRSGLGVRWNVMRDVLAVAQPALLLFQLRYIVRIRLELVVVAIEAARQEAFLSGDASRLVGGADGSPARIVHFDLV